ncbi:hypothetical protein FNF29_05653 [Cafeteria roenbergensis]|uniref:Uncharacterized protein n=1 Tax=Cafeteria roenbergensis TaxID=33653 RepID=A0A5A8CAH1_CAFRO|nr:hypothetical protein FNF29_05653 [Cafeteria roenbergensis]|eukprot:KAA0149828.1 hypothetical protein FNF29_05653 [Cafeteria roenbergensis]
MEGSHDVGIEEAVAAPGARMTVARHPPPAEEHESKRDVAAHQTERGMVGSMQELRIQTVTKNKEFDERVRALQVRLGAVETARESEREQRDLQLEAVRAGIAEELGRVDEALSLAIGSTHDTLAAEGVAPINADADRLAALEQRVYGEEVPSREEALSGPLVRRMLAERQGFEIDRTKVRAREARIVGRFESWDSETRLRHSEEAQDRFLQFSRLAEAMAEALAGEARSEEELQVWLATVLGELDGQLEGVRDARVAGDERSLDRMASSMETVQRSVLENFGAEDSDEDEPGDDGREEAAREPSA